MRPGWYYRQVVGRNGVPAAPRARGSHTRETIYGHWYDDEIDPRWREEQPYDEAYGPLPPHRNGRYLHEWDEDPTLEAVLIRVGAGQQAAVNALRSMVVCRDCGERFYKAGHGAQIRCPACRAPKSTPTSIPSTDIRERVKRAVRRHQAKLERCGPEPPLITWRAPDLDQTQRTVFTITPITAPPTINGHRQRKRARMAKTRMFNRKHYPDGLVYHTFIADNPIPICGEGRNGRTEARSDATTATLLECAYCAKKLDNLLPEERVAR